MIAGGDRFFVCSGEPLAPVLGQASRVAATSRFTRGPPAALESLRTPVDSNH